MSSPRGSLAPLASACGVCALVIVWLLAASSRANPADAFGLGSRSMAKAGAVSADVRDFSANYYNPSGLVRADTFELSLGAATAHHHLQVAGEPHDVQAVQGLVGGLVAPGRIAKVPFAFGMAVQIAGRQLSEVRAYREQQPFWPLYEPRARQLYLSVNGALGVTEWLSVGGGVAFLASTAGGFDVSGQAVQPGAGRTEYDSALEHEVVADLEPVRSLQLGLTLHPDDRWAMALVFRDEAQVKLDFEARLAGDIQFGRIELPADYRLRSHTISAFGPRQLVLGVHRRLSAWSVEVDLAWVQWSRYRSPLTRTESELRLDAPPELLSIPEAPSRPPATDPGFADRVVPRVGGEYRLSASPGWSVPLRAGYVFEKSPLRRQSQAALVDADRHLLTLGVGLDCQARCALAGIGVDLHAFGAFLPGPGLGQQRAEGAQFGAGAVVWGQLR